jgi:hypothetical protein
MSKPGQVWVLTHMLCAKLRLKFVVFFLKKQGPGLTEINFRNGINFLMFEKYSTLVKCTLQPDSLFSDTNVYKTLLKDWNWRVDTESAIKKVYFMFFNVFIKYMNFFKSLNKLQQIIYNVESRNV